MNWLFLFFIILLVIIIFVKHQFYDLNNYLILGQLNNKLGFILFKNEVAYLMDNKNNIIDVFFYKVDTNIFSSILKIKLVSVFKKTRMVQRYQIDKQNGGLVELTNIDDPDQRLFLIKIDSTNRRIEKIGGRTIRFVTKKHYNNNEMFPNIFQINFANDGTLLGHNNLEITVFDGGYKLLNHQNTYLYLSITSISTDIKKKYTLKLIQKEQGKGLFNLYNDKQFIEGQFEII
jgi:hypothetical protein